MRFVTFLLITLLFGISLAAASGTPKKIDKFRSFKASPVKAKIIDYSKEPATNYEEAEQIAKTEANPAQRVMNITATSTNVLIDSSKNGFGWLDPRIRSVDRYKGLTIDMSYNTIEVDFVLAGYRQFIVGDPATGWIGATTIDVANGLANGVFYSQKKLNEDLASGTVGGRYPGVVAIDKPFVAFNQYLSGDANTSPALSNPYTTTDYVSYGENGGLWTSSMKMDEGYTHAPFDANRLWQGSVDIVKSDDGQYHFAGVYRNWTIEGESQLNEYVILTAESDDPAYSGWTVDADPALIDTMDFLIYPSISMNKTGFGAIVGVGHQGVHEGNTFWMSELRMMVLTTQDYGKTWTEPREVSWGELGVMENVTTADSVWVWDTDTTGHWYEGDAYLAMAANHGLDIQVNQDNDVFIAYDMIGGPQASDSTFWRHYDWCGLHLAISKDGGQNFSDHHVFTNNGFYEGDSIDDSAEDYLFTDSEADISFDQAGNIYLTWLDRPHVNIEAAEKMRYNSAHEELLYKADVFTSRSVDGGETWSWKMNVTNTIHEDEYELKAASSADTRNRGTVFYAYCTVDPSTPVAQGDPDVYTHRVNRVWVGEASDFPEPDAIEDNISGVVNKFSLAQNYPNPFNPSTKIEFTARHSGNAELIVYNITGQKIKQLYNGAVKAGQKYIFDFEARNLAAGVYFYRLKMGNNTQVKKMVLIK